MSFASTLDKRVTLQALGSTQDGAGQPGALGWQNVVSEGDGKVWAGVRDVTGREFVAAGATQNTVQTVITIRYREGVKSSMRVLHGSDVYNVEAVLGRDGHRLQLMCSRGARGV